MSDLAAFLAARLAEDEAAALAAGDDEQARTWTSFDDNRYMFTAPGVSDGRGGAVVCPPAPSVARVRHVARHDPARVLRDVEADRKLIAAYLAARADVPPVDDWHEVADGVAVGVADGLEAALKIRAERFAGHTAYQPGWAP